MFARVELSNHKEILVSKSQECMFAWVEPSHKHRLVNKHQQCMFARGEL